MGAMKKIEIRKLETFFLAAAVLVLAILVPVMVYGAESVVIRSVNLTFTSEFGDQEILMPEIKTTVSGASVGDVVWKRDLEKWKAGKNERVSVFLTSDTMVFADSYNRSECKITGAKI